jgi:hypothetical protein
VRGGFGAAVAATAVIVHTHYELSVDSASQFDPIEAVRPPEIESEQPGGQRLVEPVPIAASTSDRAVALTGMTINAGLGTVLPSTAVAV